MSDVIASCHSRSHGRRCTRHLGHAGLHRHRAIMWADAGADAPRCPGSGAPGRPAADWPGGEALCSTCLRFVDVRGGLLAEHDAFDPAETAEAAARRREWLNTHGW
ncbi:hypothetical protein QL996_02330 [Planococcus sp. APC 4015]|nr:hypothetical protein [Planococcus sp. APC 4015]